MLPPYCAHGQRCLPPREGVTPDICCRVRPGQQLVPLTCLCGSQGGGGRGVERRGWKEGKVPGLWMLSSQCQALGPQQPRTPASPPRGLKQVGASLWCLSVAMGEESAPHQRLPYREPIRWWWRMQPSRIRKTGGERAGTQEPSPLIGSPVGNQAYIVPRLLLGWLFAETPSPWIEAANPLIFTAYL